MIDAVPLRILLVALAGWVNRVLSENSAETFSCRRRLGGLLQYDYRAA
jgi:hypothetical protein